MTSAITSSVGSSASVLALRPSVGATAESRSSVASDESRASAPAQVFFNPRIRFDAASNVIVSEFRDTPTGDVTRTVPSERQLQAYSRARQDSSQGDAAPAQDNRSASVSSGASSGARSSPSLAFAAESAADSSRARSGDAVGAASAQPVTSGSQFSGAITALTPRLPPPRPAQQVSTSRERPTLVAVDA